VGSGFFIAMAASVAVHLGALGGFDGPYFYAVYLIAPLTLILPCELPERVALTLMPALAFVATFALTYPHYFPYAMIHIPVITIAAVVGVSITLGHATHQLTRERYELAAELKRRALREARELERRALARVLHDDLAQVTTAARMELQCLARKAEPAFARDEFSHLSRLLDALDHASKRIVGSLREVQDDEALPDRIERMAALLERGATVSIERSVDPGAVPARQQEVVYRVVQEALTNALKHAGAQALRVAVRRDAGGLLVTVSDDGRGFDVGQRGAGWGLVGMRERVEAIGGTLSVASDAAGTTLTARVPLATVSHA
jgi:two-component system sensor histidine kinase UhpB